MTSKDIDNVTVRVVPDLNPFIQVEPTWFSNLKKGHKVHLSVIVSAYQGSPLGSLPVNLVEPPGLYPDLAKKDTTPNKFHRCKDMPPCP